MKQIITATSWNGTEFYYNSDKGRFDMADNADIYADDHYECEEANLQSAIEVAEQDGLKNVKLETVDND